IAAANEAYGGSPTPVGAGAVVAEQAGASASNLIRPGSFSILDRGTFPVSGLLPQGPSRILTGAELAAAEAAKSAANRAVRRDAAAAGADLSRMHVHEINPVKFGGSPTDLGNKVLIPDVLHNEISGWFQSLLYYINQG